MTKLKLSQLIDRRALYDSVPLFVPAIPFGFLLGLEIVEGEMPLAVGFSTSLFIFAGAAQLAVVTLAGTASLWAVIVAGLVINTRHVMYSAGMAPAFQQQPAWMRWFGSFLLIDQVFALSVLQAERPAAEFRRYYLTVGLFFYINWQLATALGMLLGPVVPESLELGFAPAIMFLALVLIGLNKLPQAVAALAGGFASLLAAGLPDRLGILVGAVVGIAAGYVAETRMGEPVEQAVDGSVA